MVRRALHVEPPSERDPGEGADAAMEALLHPELIGREEEFATILRGWEAARAGAPQYVRVVGAAGIGKTRLVTDVVARLRLFVRPPVPFKAKKRIRVHSQPPFTLATRMSSGQKPSSNVIQ